MALLGDAGDALDKGAGDRAGEQGVGERGGERAPAGELVGESKDVVVERVQAALVALGQELRFVGGHVDLDGALGLAGFATQAEIERFVDGFALKAFLAESAGQHLPQQAGAAAGGVLLLAGGAVAGAHDAAIGFAAGAHADAALRGALQRSAVGSRSASTCGAAKLRCVAWGSTLGTPRRSPAVRLTAPRA